mgnify:CR=1 FL=1
MEEKELEKNVVETAAVQQESYALNGLAKAVIAIAAAVVVILLSIIGLNSKSIRMNGVKIEEQSIRKYNNSVYFSPIIGYIGKISPEEFEEYSKQDENYSSNDYVGKTGIEYSAVLYPPCRRKQPSQDFYDRQEHERQG